MCAVFFLLISYHSTSQNLSITNNGQTGTSGTNWSTSGTNPYIITASGGPASINRSVILTQLNNGISVIVQNNNSSGNVILESGSDLTKNAGGDATLTLRANTQAAVASPITSTSSKINVILWSDYNNSNVGGVAVGTAAVINTNGGHFWAGGSSSAAGSYTWNGLTVGNGPSVGSSGANHYGMDLFTSQINTNGGDILLWSGTGNGSIFDGIGMNNNPHLNASTGNVTLITRQIFVDSNTLSVTTTGKLSLATDASNPWTTAFNWATTTSGSNVTLTSALGRPLQINNFSTLGGLSVGVYDGFGTSFNYTNFQNVNINSNIDIRGPINIHAGGINLGIGREVTARTPAGTINFQAKGGFSTVANIVGDNRGKLMTPDGGDITINADADNNNLGQLDIDWLTIDGRAGDILLEASTFVWNTGAQVTLPEFYSNSGTLTIRNVTSSNYGINTQWIAMFGNYAGVTLGREGGTELVLLNPCTVCANTALNFGTTAFQIAGPIAAYGGNINVNMNLISTSVGADILLKSARTIIVEENRTIRTNNGDITFWSNSDGIANLTDGDFIGLNSGVVVNSSNGLTDQSTGGGTITIAGGTTSQTLASGTIVPTGYAFSNRTTNWGGVHPSGVNFGKNFQTVSTNSIWVYSGGGDIVVKGQAGNAVPGVAWFRGASGAQQVMQSGSGTITFVGDNTSTGHGIELSYFSLTNTVGPTITSSNTSSSAISVTGTTVATGTAAGYQGSATFIANAIGGGVRISGQTANVSTYAAIEAGSLNAYALSGPITFISDGGLGLRSGGTWGKGSLASSSSNITLRSDRIALYPATVETTGTVTVESLGTTFSSAITFPITNLTIPNTVSGLTIGKSTNTSNITFGSATTIAGPIEVYGGNINVDQNLNTTAGAASGNILLKGSADVVLAESRSITTSGAPVVLWANSDNEATNGSIALRNGSSIVTGSGSVAGGHVWIGGGSNGTTWNGLAVGSGYAVPGTIFTPSNGGGTLQSGIYLERNSISSFGGNIKIAGDGAATTRGIVTYGNTININAGSGKIELDGQVTSSAAGNRGGVLFGLHDNTVISTINISSSAITGDAITINGVGRGAEDAIALSGTLNITSSGGGNIVMNGNALGSGRGIVVGNYYHGVMNVFANSGNIILNGNTKAVQVATPIISGLTSGPSKLNIGQGGAITSSSSDVFITADNIALAAGGIAINSSGKVTIEPASNSFASEITFPITNLTLANTITGLTLGKPTNSANIFFDSATTIDGPINVYGNIITLNANLSTTNNGDISLYTDSPLGGFNSNQPRTINAAGAFKYIPRTNAFTSSAVSYPIPFLTVTCNGLTIGKLTNDKIISFSLPSNATTISVGGPITAYGGTINLLANLSATNNGDISLYTDSPLVWSGPTFPITITAAGAFKHIPRNTTFSADVEYPRWNNTVTSTGLTIGNATNDKNITINTNVYGGAGIALYGNNVNINSNLTTTGTSTVMHLKGNTTIAAGKTITSGGNFTQDGNLTFKSNATGTAAFGPLGGTYTTTSGTVTVERYIPARRAFRFVSSAVTTTSNIRTNWQENGGTAAGLGTHITGTDGATNGFDPTGTNSTSIFTFNNTNPAWVPVGNTNNNTLTAGTPYRINIRGDRTINLSTNTPTPTNTTLRATGALATGSINAGVLSSTANAYNFIGNPYQAPVNMKTALDAATNLNNVFYYVWDPRINTRGAYISVDLTSTNGTPNNLSSAANKFLQPGQACFVRTGATPGSASLTFQESYKVVSSPNTNVFRTDTQNTTALSTIKLRLFDSNSLALNLNALDGLVVFFDDAFSSSVDQNDAGKFTNPDEMLSTFNNGDLISIEKRQHPTSADIIPLRTSQYRVTDYTLVAEGTNLNGVPAYLHDQFLQTYTEIPQSGVVNYPFNVVTTNAQTTASDRFRIVFSNPLLNTANNEWKNFTLYPNPSKQGNFNIILGQPLENGKVTIYNTLGVKVYNQDLENTIENSITPNQSMPTGVYYVEIQNGSERSIKKLIIE